MIGTGCKVRVLYEGRLSDGTVFDSSALHGGNPLEFIVGAGTIIPGLEKTVSRMEPCQNKTVTIAAVDAYGDYDDELIQRVPAADFPNADKLPVGGYIMLDIDGERKRTKVISVDDECIAFDFNHELAGYDLEFDLEVVEVVGETGSLVENEVHAADCACGCHKLKAQLCG